MSEHSILSASKSHRWSRCPGSIEAERDIPDTKSGQAEEGTLAHTLAERMYFRKDYSELNVSQEMVEYVQVYIDYINNLCLPSNETLTYVEKKVNYFPTIDPPQFGTSDAVILSYNYSFDEVELHIVDLKYGFKKEDAFENTQLLLYAIGVLGTLPIKEGYKLSTITLHIVQPRISNISAWSISPSDLKYWEGYLLSKGEIAMTPGAPRVPSEIACKYCRAAPTCIAPFNFVSELPIEKQSMSVEDVKHVLDNSKMVTDFLSRVEEKAYEDLSLGGELPGYKLVAGRNVRKLNHDAEEKLLAILGDKIYSKSILGLKELEKLVDKETLQSLVYLTQNRPVLVKESDKREALVLEELNYEIM